MLLQLRQIVEQAGQIVLDHYPLGDCIVHKKEDQSPVTEADLASSAFIQNSLEQAFHYPVLSEETPVPYEKRRDWDTFWLVDPLDGTKDFLAANDEFTINIALIKDGLPIFGIIFAPALGELFYAEKGKGAYSVKKGIELRLPNTSAQGLVGLRSRFHDTPRTQQFLELNQVNTTIAVGSAIKFGRLAEGVANLYPRYTGSMEWDIAAGHIILKEANCRILCLETMSEPSYNKRTLKNGFFVAYSNSIRPEDLKL